MRRLVLFLAGLTLPLLLAEGALRVVAPSLRDPAPWPSVGLEIKAGQIDELADVGTEVDVVFVGSSVTEAAVDPDRLGRSAYNSAVPFSSPLSMADWLDQRLWDLDPEILVVGLPIWGADSTAGDDPMTRRLDEIREFEAMRSGWAGASELWVRRRQLLEVLEGSAASEPITESYTAAGHLTVYYDRDRPAPGDAARVVGRPFPGFSDDNVAALEHIAATAAERGTALVLLLEPGGCPPVLAGCADGDSAAEARAAVEALAADLDAAFVDGRTLATDAAWFADDAHFNAAGTAAFTAFIAAELDTRFGAQTS